METLSLQKCFIKLSPEEAKEALEAKKAIEPKLQQPTPSLEKCFVKLSPEEAEKEQKLRRALVSDAQLPMPPEICSPSLGVYQPEPINTALYKKKAKPTIQEMESCLVHTLGLRIMEAEDSVRVFMRMTDPDYYRELRGTELQLAIDEFFRKMSIFLDPVEIDQIKKTVQYDSRLVVKEVSQLPLHIWPFHNGLFDIAAGTLFPNNGKYFYTHFLHAIYNPASVCPLFDQLLISCTGNDAVLQELIWQVIGYLLSSDSKAKAFFVFRGPKDTGKSLIAGIIQALLGEQAVAAMGINEIGKRFSVAELKDKKLAICMDLSNEPLSASAVGMIKAITGGDMIRTEAKYQQGVSRRIHARLLFGSNHEIRTKMPDAAFFDRQVIIPFCYPVPKEKQDKGLFEKIAQAELSGIAVKAAKAYLRLVYSNYQFPSVSSALPPIDEIDHEKVIRDFAAQCCEFDLENRVSTEELYHTYIGFTNENRLPPLEKVEFSKTFNHIFKQLEKKKINFSGKSLQGYVGIGLKIPRDKES